MTALKKHTGIEKIKTPGRRHGDEIRHRPYENTGIEKRVRYDQRGGIAGIEKIETGIEGFDMISEGGVPKGAYNTDCRHIGKRQDRLCRPVSRRRNTEER